MDITQTAQNRARPAIVVAIPARDEAEWIGPCLIALDQQRLRPDEVVLLLNNCVDETEAIARALARSLRFALHIVACDLPEAQANAGHARRMAMQIAAERAGPGGVLLTTDADSQVPPDWVRRNLAQLHRGADLVCGCAIVERIEAEMIPAHLHDDDLVERRLITLLDEMAWMADPDPYDLLPRHTECPGASLAVWVSAFQRVGGIPAVAMGEDRAFVEALRQVDARIRHDPEIEVVVSGRVIGRAKGGMADAIRRRMVKQDEFTDEQVEPAENAFRRVTLRSRARALWCGGLPDDGLAADLALDPAVFAAAMAKPFFGAAWADVEGRSPVLVRRPVRFVDLPRGIAVAERLLSRLTPPETLAAD